MWDNNTIEDELQRNILEYGISVNTDRSIPDAKSGLKPVAKRILWDAFIEGRTSGKPHVKSARIVGDTMGRFHPHGDTSIYGAMVRLAQNWVMRYPLIDGHGNFGNLLGDGPAAMRYTEARLAKIAEDGLLAGIKKNCVDFIPNYDETEDEPVTLPAIFPNLLCNPNEGIGWALACSWAPHNLTEVAQAINDFLDGKEPMLPGPDFPCGGLIINQNDIPAIMKTGHGSVKIRGRYKINKQNIVFYEIPYGTRIEDLMSEIGNACNEGKIVNVSDIRSEKTNLIIEVDKGVDPESVVTQLFNKTNLQTTFSYNQVALVDKTPMELNLKQAIEIYVKHNIDCLIKEYNFDLAKAQDRLHIVEGLLICLEDIDNVIQLIKKSENSAAAKEKLIEKYNLSEIQAKSVLAMRLSSLAHMEKIELENEQKELVSKIADIKDILAREERQIKIIRERLSTIVKKYGDARRTELTHIDIPKDKKEKEVAEVIPEDVVVVTTASGLVKKVPTSSFKVQKKNGKGIKNNDDIILDVVKTNTVDTMMFFSDKGKLYKVLADKIPSGTNVSKGTSIRDFVKIDDSENIIAVSSLHRKSTPKYILFFTKNGIVKKSLLSLYTESNRAGGTQAIKLAEGDEIVDISFQDEEEIIVLTKKGMGIRFESSEINAIGKIAMGVKSIKLNDGDEVIAALPIHKMTDELAIVYTDGSGKKMPMSEMPKQGRGGKGVIVAKDLEIAGAAMVSDEDNILISAASSSIVITAKDIPSLGRTAIGNKLIKSNNVKSITKI